MIPGASPAVFPSGGLVEDLTGSREALTGIRKVP